MLGPRLWVTGTSPVMTCFFCDSMQTKTALVTARRRGRRRARSRLVAGDGFGQRVALGAARGPKPPQLRQLRPGVIDLMHVKIKLAEIFVRALVIGIARQRLPVIVERARI